jgi:two-component system chemotaxis response regulator CheB
MSIRALIVDDSGLYGATTRRAIEGIAGVELIGRPANSRDAAQKLAADSPDLVVTHVENADLSGLEVLRVVRRHGLKTIIVVVSGAEARERDVARHALELGAADCVSRPVAEAAGENVALLRSALGRHVAAAAYRKEVGTLLRGESAPRTPVTMPAEAPPRVAPGREPDPARQVHARTGDPEPADDIATRMRRCAARQRPSMVLIGASTGGTEALARIIPNLPAQLSVPVLVVQHMPPQFTAHLAESLNLRSALPVSEAREGETAMAGRVYIAPGGKHLKIGAGPAKEIRLRVTADPPENNCRPAVDCLFRSAAQAFPGRAVAVILTGMGRDGTAGMALLKDSGCMTIAQDEASCTVFGMPKEAIQAGVVDLVAPLDSIAAEITKALR